MMILGHLQEASEYMSSESLPMACAYTTVDLGLHIEALHFLRRSIPITNRLMQHATSYMKDAHTTCTDSITGI
jgi:hypothetical protein